MATIDSNLVHKLTRHRGIYSGQLYDVKGRIALPAGTVLATGDILRFVPLGENQRVNKVKAYIIGLLPSATVTIGYAQMLDAEGNPVVVERRGPFGDTSDDFTSPVSDTDAYAPAAVLSTAREVLQTAGGKLAGPVYLCAEVGTGGTVGAGGVEIFIGAEFDGETSILEVAGGNPFGNAYLLDPDQGTDATP